MLIYFLSLVLAYLVFILGLLCGLSVKGIQFKSFIEFIKEKELIISNQNKKIISLEKRLETTITINPQFLKIDENMLKHFKKEK